MLDIQLIATAKVRERECHQFFAFSNQSLVAVPPAPKIPKDKELFPIEGTAVPNVQFLKAHFFDEGKLSEEQVCRIVEAGTELLANEPNLLEIPAPITSKKPKGESYSLLISFIISCWRHSRTILRHDKNVPDSRQ